MDNTFDSSNWFEGVWTAGKEHDDDIGRRTFRLVYHTLLLLLGVPGNCLILHVYWTKTLKTSTHVFIMALALADFFVCLLRIRELAIHITILLDGEIPRIYTFLRSLETTAVGTSVMITAVIAADRYDCVCRPHRRFFTHRRGKIAAWASFMFSVCVNVPAFVDVFVYFPSNILEMLVFVFQTIFFVTALVIIVLCYRKVYITIRKHVKVSLVSVASVQMKNTDRLEITVVDNAISVLTGGQNSHSNPTGAAARGDGTGTTANSRNHVVSCNLSSPPGDCLQQAAPIEEDIRVNRDQIRNPVQVPDNDVKTHLQRKTTKMLFVASVVFVLAWLPYCIYVLVKLASFYGWLHPSPQFLLVMLELSYVCYINNAVNPLIYGLANRRFRKDCGEALGKMRVC
ncbi:5-hydroxytryptamine receptor 2B-like [Asterias rubens]|uniref:5-hydroxytryptamine receptor 2B-like n=1 Tax=Asterias rubens TaxID=7604 RepID=UPI001455CF66|nr:5-hydroxytryptamine receptor 2B-like [Asterias rubens]